MLGQARIEDQDRIAAQQRQELVQIEKVDGIAGTLHIDEQRRLGGTIPGPQQLSADRNSCLAVKDDLFNLRITRRPSTVASTYPRLERNLLPRKPSKDLLPQFLHQPLPP